MGNVKPKVIIEFDAKLMRAVISEADYAELKAQALLLGIPVAIHIGNVLTAEAERTRKERQENAA